MCLFKESKETMSKKLKKRVKTVPFQIENISKMIKNFKKNWLEILELKTTITEVKKSDWRISIADLTW